MVLVGLEGFEMLEQRLIVVLSRACELKYLATTSSIESESIGTVDLSYPPAHFNYTAYRPFSVCSHP